jgi:hypothetical protein
METRLIGNVRDRHDRRVRKNQSVPRYVQASELQETEGLGIESFAKPVFGAALLHSRGFAQGRGSTGSPAPSRMQPIPFDRHSPFGRDWPAIVQGPKRLNDEALQESRPRSAG